MPHLHTHATVCSMRRLVVPCGYELERIWSYWRFLFQILSVSAYWAKQMYIIAKRNNPSLNQLACVYRWNMGIQAAMYTDPFCRQWFILLTHCPNILNKPIVNTHEAKWSIHEYSHFLLQIDVRTGIQAAMYTDPFYRQWFVLLTHLTIFLERQSFWSKNFILSHCQ